MVAHALAGHWDRVRHMIVFAINYTINYLEYLYRTKRLFEINSHRSLATLVRDYRCGNIDERHFEINDLSTAGFEMEPKEKQRAEKIHRHLREDIISKRNERMAHRLNKLFSSNPGIVIFTAIGTGHFFGNDSVLHHLHKMGYVVQSVKEDDVIIPPRNRDRTYTFNSLWLRDNSSMSGLSVEVVHVHSSAPSIPYMAIGTALSLMLYSMLNSMSQFL
ncbi:unnamed protein product [Nippostrongylus brasiliensis]|uniref:Metalloprotease TIKI homolog n=1 Tax=Nippostrongylus brasiliensis TaxID=27835 RepID=A0A0N4XT00_NIPBR|nr:unnamed protein product [Nippostrongylus brasiliensis]